MWRRRSGGGEEALHKYIGTCHFPLLFPLVLTWKVGVEMEFRSGATTTRPPAPEHIVRLLWAAKLSTAVYAADVPLAGWTHLELCAYLDLRTWTDPSTDPGSADGPQAF